MKLSLPDVTLVMIETRQHELARLAIRDCLELADFAEVLIFSDRTSMFMDQGRVIYVPDWPDKIGWSRCNWQEVAPHVATSHALCIQWDSWIVKPEMWRDEFMQYDYIGAPWWYADGMNVGNGGFCLKSTKLMRYLRKHRDRYPCVNALDDDLLCRKYRPALQDAGFVWAPEELAIEFSFEIPQKWERKRHFGFHAAYNFDYGCGFDRLRILERARLMAGQSYMTGSNPYFWDGFVKSNPWVPEVLEKEKAQAVS